MKTLIATLILSSLSLNAMANDNPRPELDSAKLAQEMVDFTKKQILQQAGTSMLAQANQSSQGVLQLLRG